MKTLEELADEIFGLCYYSEGAFTYPLDRAPPEFRERFATNLVKAKERERAELQKQR